MGGAGWRPNLEFADDPETHGAMIHPVEASYFDVFDLQLLAGRTWSEAEDPAVSSSGPGSAESDAASVGSAPAVLSEPLAVRVFGAAAAAVGRSVTLSGNSLTIIGVVADNRHYGPDQEHGPSVYVPAGVMPFTTPRAHMAVLTAGPQAGLPRALAQAVWRAEPDLPVPSVRPMDEWAGRATSRARFMLTVALVSSWLPARRAAKTDPMETLREE